MSLSSMTNSNFVSSNVSVVVVVNEGCDEGQGRLILVMVDGRLGDTTPDRIFPSLFNCRFNAKTDIFVFSLGFKFQRFKFQLEVV